MNDFVTSIFACCWQRMDPDSVEENTPGKSVDGQPAAAQIETDTPIDGALLAQ